MKTVVLDDDPTGTQSAIGVRVLLEWSPSSIRAALDEASSVYIQTNSRALDESAAIELVDRIAADVAEALPGEYVRFVLRGDSTLRGHVFAETERLLEPDDLMMFVPAFPAGGRTTRRGVHYVRVDGVDVPAHLTEYALDPVFPFGHSALADYVREKSARTPFEVPLGIVRGEPETLIEIFSSAPAGSVIVPDAVDDDDISRIARAVEALEEAGRRLVVRSAAPLAAELAGVRSRGLLVTPLRSTAAPTLVVCGSHTGGATAQLEALSGLAGAPIEIPTDSALIDPAAAGAGAAREGHSALAQGRTLVVVSSDRVRRASDNGLHHGERVMSALVAAAHALAPEVESVIAKGGITSAQIARDGLGATSAFVLGQILPGVSVWRITTFEGRTILYAVVPGNVGDPSTLVEVAQAFGH